MLKQMTIFLLLNSVAWAERDRPLIDRREQITEKKSASGYAIATEDGGYSIFGDINWGVDLWALSLVRFNQTRDITMGLLASNQNRQESEFDAEVYYSYSRQIDPFINSTIRSSDLRIQFNYDINSLIYKFGLTSFYQYKSGFINNTYLYKSYVDVSPLLGIKFDIFESENIRELSLSYLPIYNYIKQGENGPTEQSLVHALRFNFALAFKKGKYILQEESWWKEVNSFDGHLKKLRGPIFSNKFSFSYWANKRFKIALVHKIESDRRRKFVLGLPATEERYGFSFSYWW